MTATITSDMVNVTITSLMMIDISTSPTLANVPVRRSLRDGAAKKNERHHGRWLGQEFSEGQLQRHHGIHL